MSFLSSSSSTPCRYQPSRLEDTTDPEVIISKAKLILNKLSVTNFDKLSDQFMTGTHLLFFSLTTMLLHSYSYWTECESIHSVDGMEVYFLVASLFMSHAFSLPLSSWSHIVFTFLPSMILFSLLPVGVDSVELMGRAIDLIVLCAQMNEHFSFMYAELCKKITDKWSSGTADEVSTALPHSSSLHCYYLSTQPVTQWHSDILILCLIVLCSVAHFYLFSDLLLSWYLSFHPLTSPSNCNHLCMHIQLNLCDVAVI